jgi:hypothetical protein
VFSTFLTYLALVAFCLPSCSLVILPARYLLGNSWFLSYPLLLLAYYQLLVVAHVVGRFYWRNQESLNWDT